MQHLAIIEKALEWWSKHCEIQAGAPNDGFRLHTFKTLFRLLLAALLNLYLFGHPDHQKKWTATKKPWEWGLIVLVEQ